MSRIHIERDQFRLNLELSLPEHQVLGLWGASGCGKTSVLRALAGLDQHPGSRVNIHGQVCQTGKVFVPPEQRALAYVFQDQQLFPHFDVRANLDYAWQRRLPTDAVIEPEEVIDVFDLQSLLTRRPSQLSGGEQQRVALARALLRQPRLMLLDEPLASLDQSSKNRLLPYLRMINSRYGLPMIYVSHQLDELMMLADDVMIIYDGQAMYQGPINQAMTDRATGLIESKQAGTVLSGQVVGQDLQHGLLQVKTTGGLLLWVKGQQDIGSRFRLIITANQVSLSLQPPEHSSVLNLIEATIVDIVSSGAHDHLVVVASGTETLLARISGRSLQHLKLSTGMAVIAQVKTQGVESHR
jgi:molybdate transport system ATP-binding protein